MHKTGAYSLVSEPLKHLGNAEESASHNIYLLLLVLPFDAHAYIFIIYDHRY
jgi:hypothetical protein